VCDDRGVDAQRVAALGALQDLPAEELETLSAALTAVEVGAGTQVVALDSTGTAVYFVEEGEAEVVSGDEVDEVLGPGDVFGEIGLLLTGERTATVVARTPMRLLSLSGLDFNRIRGDIPEIERRLRALGIERGSR
jgi:CRP/FNR family transcriptional regulator, cyclic AMP receptor protein